MKKSKKTIGFIVVAIAILIEIVYGFNSPERGSMALTKSIEKIEKSIQVAWLEKITEAKKPLLDLEQLKADLSEDLDAPNILKEDILRRWYYGTKEQKKYGTPDEWVFVDDGDQSRWVSPDAIEESAQIDEKDLCKLTAGKFIESCFQSASASCRQIEKSHCECSEGSKWKAEQGCIMTNEDGIYISINQRELEQEFYLGLPNQKKLNTPGSWGWIEAGQNSAWRKP